MTVISNPSSSLQHINGSSTCMITLQNGDRKQWHMSGLNISPGSLTHSPLKQQGLPIQDVTHAECDLPKWLTVSPRRQCERGNCAARTTSKALLTHSALKQQGPPIQLGSLLCQRGLLPLPPAPRAANVSNESFLFRR